MEELYEDTITELSPEEENQFNAWAGEMRLEGKIHPQDNFEDYDMRGYWKETGGKGDASSGTHFPDTYKRPNHPTFSIESKYAQGNFKEKYGHLAGRWEEDNFVPPVSEEELYNKYVNEEQEEYKTLSEKESLEKKFGVTIDYYDNDLSKTVTRAKGSLAGKSIEDIADKKDMSPTFVETLCDISYGFFSGVYEGLRATQELGAAIGGKIAEWQVGEKIEGFDPDKDLRGVGINYGEAPEPVTTAGGLSKVAGQVGVGLMGAKTVGATKLASIAKNAYGTKAVSLLSNAFVGFTADTMSFSANEENFADVLKQLGLPTIEAIAKNPNDTYWQKKIKNGVDGLVAGAIIDGIVKSAKMFYNAGKQAIRNRKVYEGILEYPSPTKKANKVYDAEFEIVENGKIQKPTTKQLEIKQGSIPDNNRNVKLLDKPQPKLAHENSIVKDIKDAIGADDKAASEFAKELEDKDIEKLLERLLPSGNKKSREIFEKYTGISLPKTQKEIEKKVVEWANIDYNHYIKSKEKGIIAKEESLNIQKEKDALDSAIKNLDKKLVRDNGRIITYKELIENLINEGYEFVGKRGAYYRLQNKKGVYENFKDKDVKKYIDYLINKKKGSK